jgi:hypothetical protein
MKGNRERIYDAEIEAGLTVGPGATPEGMQAWLDWVARSKFWQENSSVRHFKVVYPSMGKMSGIVKFSGEGERRVAEVHYRPFSMSEGGACHEITHITKNLYREGTSVEDMERDHGPAFATMYLRVVKRYISAGTARRLEKAYIKHKVNYDAGWNHA